MRRRDEILVAARKIAASEGIENMTVRDVAFAASVSVGAVYLHFGSRDDLLAHLIADGLRRAQDSWLARLTHRRGKNLTALSETYIEALLEHSDLFEATARLRLDLNRATLSHEAAAELRNTIRSVVTPFETAIAAIDPAIQNPHRAGAALWSALNGVMLTFARQPGRGPAEERQFLHAQARLLAQAFESLLGKSRKRE